MYARYTMAAVIGRIVSSLAGECRDRHEDILMDRFRRPDGVSLHTVNSLPARLRAREPAGASITLVYIATVRLHLVLVAPAERAVLRFTLLGKQSERGLGRDTQVDDRVRPGNAEDLVLHLLEPREKCRSLTLVRYLPTL